VPRVEYLITVDQKEAFCKSVSSFNNLLRTIDGVSISKTEMKFGSLVMRYEIQCGEIERDKHRFFHLKISVDDESQNRDFEGFLKNIRSLLHKAAAKPPQILWDDVSFGYAKTAYPIVHEIENTMRKLITKFMLINVGGGWAKEAVPKEVLESVRSKDAKLDQNYLYEVDFIQLSNFLFKEYANINPAVLIERLKKAEKLDDLNLSELKLAIPQSNWDRFFSKIVNCESEYLRSRWERLYERRNQVAHNRPVTRGDFEEIVALRDELAPKLQHAIENLDQVTVSEDEREMVSENVALTKGEGYYEFLSAWNEFHENLLILVDQLLESEGKHESRPDPNNIRSLVNVVTKRYHLLTSDQRSEIQDLVRLRNYIVHEPSVIVPSQVLSRHLESVLGYTRYLKDKLNGIARSGAPVRNFTGDKDDDDQLESPQMPT